jgi:EAL domain-containing protein (putative c-di-GMP-specific phosphodiesterase class I)
LGRRLKEFVGKKGEVARSYGSGFLFFLNLEHLSKKQVVEQLDMMKENLCNEINLKKVEIELTISVGITFFPEDGEQPSVLLKQAETALKEAKRLGGNRIIVFQKDLHKKAREYLLLLPRLKKALQNDEFIFYCQPRIDVKQKKVCGGEILVRWKPPGEDIVSPRKFIWVLEESGLIIDLGIWIAEQTCKALMSLPEDIYMALNLSFNVSPQQLWGSYFIDNLLKIFNKYKICPKRVKVEITENIFIERTEEIIQQLKTLANLGVGIALDDFGTGYSSLQYLAILPVDDLKIDAIFVKGLPGSKEDTAIVKTIVALARVLGKRVVAEGVETKEQLKCLMEMGVDEVQGFYFAPPLPWEEFKKFVLHFSSEKYFCFS